MFERVVRIGFVVLATILAPLEAAQTAEEREDAPAGGVRWETDGWHLRAERRKHSDDDNRLVFEQVVMSSRDTGETAEGLKIRADAVVIEKTRGRKNSIASWRAERSVRIIGPHQLYIMSDTASWNQSERRNIIVGSEKDSATLLRSRADGASWRLPAKQIVISIDSGSLELRDVGRRPGGEDGEDDGDTD